MVTISSSEGSSGFVAFITIELYNINCRVFKALVENGIEIPYDMTLIMKHDAVKA